ncbi:d-4,5 unsaturated-glucuronyl hydrolase-like protein [Pseudohyphozyma bogoriensis]|nr:d-4,5 unsaturated-glucuronyl hydrolase-like protein [Pseudohyphozyma bogoriensis]
MRQVSTSNLALFTLLSLAALSSGATVPSDLFSSSTYSKLLTTAQSQSSPSSWPEYTSTNGSWLTFDATTWTSGFLPATFYLLNERHSKLCPASTPTATNGSTTDWLSYARAWSPASLYTADEALTNTHDVGFLSFPAQEELKLDATNASALAAVEAEAVHLAERFSSVVGCTKSWDNGGAGDFEVVSEVVYLRPEGMINIQLFMLAAELTSNSTYTSMAISHANKTIENHIRNDSTSYHVVDYSPTDGSVQWRGTAQGYSNTSTWSRGQAWGVYGFATMYNYTGYTGYLDVSRNMAQWYLDNLPSSGVAYWDFNAPTPTTLDTSASLILSSALLQLSSFEAANGNSSGATHWSDAAVTLLGNVVDQAVTGWEGASLVGNGTVNNDAVPPNNNTGIVYGDYYFIEAGNRLLQLGLANCSDGAPAVGASSTYLSRATSFTSSTLSVSQITMKDEEKCDRLKCMGLEDHRQHLSTVDVPAPAASTDGDAAPANSIRSLVSASLSVLLNTFSSKDLQAMADRIVQDQTRDAVQQTFLAAFPALKDSAELFVGQGAAELSFKWSYGYSDDSGATWSGGMWCLQKQVYLEGTITRPGKEVVKFQVAKYTADDCGDSLDQGIEGGQKGFREFVEELVGLMGVSGWTDGGVKVKEKREWTIKVLAALLPAELVAFGARYSRREGETRLDKMLASAVVGQEQE